MSKLRWIIYIQPLHRIVLVMLLLVMLWAYAGHKAGNQRWWTGANAVIFLGAVAVILYLTLGDRVGGTHQAEMTPLRSFAAAKEQPELYRTMLMNVFLFLPLGLSLPFSLPIRHNAAVTVLFAFCLSAVIEALQYQYGLGLCEVDDVIMNTLGSWIGTWASLIW